MDQAPPAAAAAASFCVPKPVINIYHGLENLASWDHAKASVFLGLLMTAITLWWFGWYVLFSQRARSIKGTSLLRHLAFYYCLSVGAFGAIRGIWDTGRLLIGGAAFHNLMEWGFLAHVWLDKKTALQFFKGASFYIWTVITISVVLIPQLILSLAFEQTLGILCDYFLLFSFFKAWRDRRKASPELGRLWRSAFFASLLHFSQIWPLVAGTVLGPCHKASSVIEFLLTTGSVPCFYFYTDFALRWDELLFGTSAADASADGESNGNGKGKGKTAKLQGPYQETNNWRKLRLFVFLGLLAGAGTILPEGALMDLIETMPQAIRREEGCNYYNVVKEPGSPLIRFIESWSSWRTLRKHMVTSPSVLRTFGNPQFRALYTNQTMLGPYAPLVPCSEAQKKAPAKQFTVSTTVDASVDCIWSKLDNWSDVSWVQGTQKVEMMSPFMRKITNARCSLIEMRQLSPPVPQPVNGHSLIYHILDGCLVGAGTPGEVYSGQVSVVPSPDNPKQSLLTYQSTIVAKDPAMASKFFQGIYADFTANRLPYVKGVFEAACKPAPAAPPAPVYTVKDPTYFYMFQTRKDANDSHPFASAAEFLSYITGDRKPAPKAVYVGALSGFDWASSGANGVPEPDFSKKTAYDVAAVIEFPPADYGYKPEELGKGIAYDVWSTELVPAAYPQKPEEASDCPDGPWLTQTPGLLTDGRDVHQAKLDAGPAYKVQEASIAFVKQLIADKKPGDGPSNGINLLRFKEGKAGCYSRYLQEVRELMHAVGGHLHFWGAMKPRPGSTDPHYEAILICYYPNRQAVVDLADNPAYKDMALIRLASIQDMHNLGPAPVEGSLFQML
ncbi:hypothetical protein WJX72_001908 [[Myrmecia] bisecta]|uniref:DUF1330 domain-containing protein n=1 Tax=[Myrmecia] bisecta TaxID=41462 RepID=A0AAW1R4Q1_9CHLO